MAGAEAAAISLPPGQPSPHPLPALLPGGVPAPRREGRRPGGHGGSLRRLLQPRAPPLVPGCLLEAPQCENPAGRRAPGERRARRGPQRRAPGCGDSRPLRQPCGHTVHDPPDIVRPARHHPGRPSAGGHLAAPAESHRRRLSRHRHRGPRLRPGEIRGPGAHRGESLPGQEGTALPWTGGANPDGALPGPPGADGTHRGLFAIAVDPAYTSRWGAEHWLGVLRSVSAETGGHHCAAVVIARRGLGQRARRRGGCDSTPPEDGRKRATDSAVQPSPDSSAGLP